MPGSHNQALVDPERNQALIDPDWLSSRSLLPCKAYSSLDPAPKDNWAVFKTPHFTGWLIKIPLLDYYNPQYDG